VSRPTPTTNRGAALKLGQDLGALIQGDDADTRSNRLAVLIPTDLTRM
jgi:hypothetical protein